MALFDSIREKTDSTTARLLFGAVCVVFVFSFIGIGMGGRTVTYAKVNGSRITDIDLQKKMRLIQRQEQFSSLNETELKSLQEDVLESLIIERSVLGEAQELGIEVSDEEVNYAILSIDGFKDASGDFSEELYEQAVKREGFGSKTKFEARTRQDIAYNKLRELITSSVYVSATEATSQATDSMTTLSVEWIRISEASVRDTVTVTDADIDAELAKNLEAIQKIYDADLLRKYQKPERVSIARIILPFTDETKEEIKTKADNVRKEAIDGVDFTSLVQSHSSNKSNDGTILDAAKDQLPTEVGAVIFTDNPPAISEVIETTEGYQIVKFIEKKAAETIAFDDTKKEIAKQSLLNQKISDATKSQAELLLTQWKSTEGISEELLSSYKIESAGPFPKTSPELPGAGNSPELLSTLATATTTGFLEMPFQTSGGLLIANITSIALPDPQMLEMRTKYIKVQLETMRKQSVWDDF
jgi:parvulin-like peptidyl-prolyl isomerase